MKNNKGSVKTILIAVLAVVLLLGGVFGYFYITMTEIRFDYVNSKTSAANTEEEVLLSQQGYGVDYPFFGNSSTLGEGGYYNIYVGPIGDATQRNIDVYGVVNGKMHDYAYELLNLYRNYVETSYTVENDTKTLKITFTGKGYPDGFDGESVPLNKTFVFNIENASRENLPTLISES